LPGLTLSFIEREDDYSPLPLKFKPGTDLSAKLLLNNTNVINLIVNSLLGKYTFLPQKETGLFKIHYFM
jgi:hypothetical protein